MLVLLRASDVRIRELNGCMTGGILGFFVEVKGLVELVHCLGA